MHLFVYGTLKSDGPLHEHLERLGAELINPNVFTRDPSWVMVNYRNLFPITAPINDPSLSPYSGAFIRGELYRFETASVIHDLDRIERGYYRMSTYVMDANGANVTFTSRNRIEQLARRADGRLLVYATMYVMAGHTPPQQLERIRNKVLQWNNATSQVEECPAGTLNETAFTEAEINYTNWMNRERPISVRARSAMPAVERDDSPEDEGLEDAREDEDPPLSW